MIDPVRLWCVLDVLWIFFSLFKVETCCMRWYNFIDSECFVRWIVPLFVELYRRVCASEQSYEWAPFSSFYKLKNIIIIFCVSVTSNNLHLVCSKESSWYHASTTSSLPKLAGDCALVFRNTSIKSIWCNRWIWDQFVCWMHCRFDGRLQGFDGWVQGKGQWDCSRVQRSSFLLSHCGCNHCCYCFHFHCQLLLLLCT